MQRGTVLRSNECPRDGHVMKPFADVLKRVGKWDKFGRKNMRTIERQGNYIKSLFPINFRRVKVVCITRCFFVLSCFVFFFFTFLIV